VKNSEGTTVDKKENRSTTEDALVTSVMDMTLMDSKVSAPVSSDASKDLEKKLKSLRKKLREIEELEQKMEVDLNDEQRLKLSRKADIEAEIASLMSS
jgi:hypothetical protein